MKLELQIAPAPILLKKAPKVVKFDQQLEFVARKMEQVMIASRGIGIAAPQIGFSRRIVIVKDGKENRVMVNPKIIWKNDEVSMDAEGCLSCPGRYRKILRHTEVKVEFQTLTGRKTTMRLKDFPAICIQHEIDHLNGILIAHHPDPDAKTEKEEALDFILGKR